VDELKLINDKVLLLAKCHGWAPPGPTIAPFSNIKRSSNKAEDDISFGHYTILLDKS
jgi:hypothetical protein